MGGAIGRQPELPRQHDGAASGIVWQQRYGVTALQNFPLLGLPFAVAMAIVEFDFLQPIMPLGEHMDVLDTDAIGDGHGNPLAQRGGSRPSSHLANTMVWAS